MVPSTNIVQYHGTQYQYCTVSRYKYQYCTVSRYPAPILYSITVPSTNTVQCHGTQYQYRTSGASICNIRNGDCEPLGLL